MRRIKIAAQPRPRRAQVLLAWPASRRSAACRSASGWDTIDETYARMRGFRTVSYTDLVEHPPPAARAAPTARCAATPATASAPTSRTHPLSWVALRAVKVGDAPAARCSRAWPSSTGTCAPRSGASSGSPTASTAASRGASCAGGCSAPSFHITREQHEHRDRRAGLRRAAAGDGVRRGRHRRHRRRRRRREGRRRCARAAPTSRTSPDERLQARRWSAAASAPASSTLHDAEAILICVPTPLTANREPELGPLLSAARALGGVMRAGQTIVLESTTFPGTTRDYMVPLLEESGPARRRGLRAGVLARARRPGPHRLHDPHHAEDRRRPDRRAAPRRAAEVYGARLRPRSCRSARPRSAEMAKLLENIFRSVNIALVNELAMLADRMGIDIWEVVDAASTKPFGFMRFEPGPGMGGHCLPVDPFYLTWRAREFDFATEFIELAGKVNQQHAVLLPARRSSARSTTPASPCAAPRSLVLGVSYKPGVGDIRESPALKIIDLLPGARRRGRLPRPLRARAAGLRPAAHRSSTRRWTAPTWRSIVTAHPDVDHDGVVRAAPGTVDFRGVTRHVAARRVAEPPEAVPHDRRRHRQLQQPRHAARRASSRCAALPGVAVTVVDNALDRRLARRRSPTCRCSAIAVRPQRRLRLRLQPRRGRGQRALRAVPQPGRADRRRRPRAHGRGPGRRARRRRSSARGCSRRTAR